LFFIIYENTPNSYCSFVFAYHAAINLLTLACFTWLNTQVVHSIQYYYIIWLYTTYNILHTLYYSLCRVIRLDIGGNPLNTVPEVVSSLEELDVRRCKLPTLPEGCVSQCLYCACIA